MDPLSAAALAAAGAACLCAVPMLLRYRGEAVAARACAERRLLVLTYDDGPGDSMTDRVLDALAAHGARASFFALGRRAAECPAALDRAAREGHEIGTHSHDHRHPWKTPPWTPVGDMKRGFRSLSRWAGRDALFRPPYGKLTPFTWTAALARGTRFGWWTIDSGDTWPELPKPDAVVESVRRNRGGVVLMHDFERTPERAEYVLELTRRLLEMARAEGIGVVTLGELLGADGRVGADPRRAGAA